MGAGHQTTVSDVKNKQGGAAETVRPIQENAMLNVIDRPAEGKSKQEVLDFLYEGFVKISALEMNRLLHVCQYEHQRPISERHVAVLSDLMVRGAWQPKSQIDFAILDGKYILINGYHRAYAQVRSGKTIEWSVAFHPVKTEAELRTQYFAYDTNIRPRGVHDILRANEFGERHGISNALAKSLYGAVPYIASKFQLNPKDRNFLVEKQVDRRLQVAEEYVKAAGRYAACLEGMHGSRRLKMVSGAITAVAVVTLRWQSDRAWEFWAGVANNDGLKKGDPRLALVTDMMLRKVQAGTVEMFAPAMIAWNAFFNDRELKIIKVTEHFVPVIDGTPFNGRKG